MDENQFNNNQQPGFQSGQYQQPQQPQQPFPQQDPYAQQPMSPFQQQPMNVVTGESKAFSIISLILGILSVVLCCTTWIAMAMGAAGIVLGVLGMKKAPSSKGMAIAGLILSIIGFLLALFLVIGVLSNVGALNDFLNEYGYNY